MTADLRFPLHWPEGWPRTDPWKRTNAPFKVPPQQARQEMLDELARLGAREVIVSSDQPINRDGSISLARRSFSDPGVAVYFKRKGADFVLACDQYAAIHDNIRAVGKTIEALRGIERWGASDMLDRAFTGFTAIPGPQAVAPEKWWEILGVSQAASLAEIDAAWREQMKSAHPDRRGGSDELAARLNAARDAARAARTYNL